MPEGRKILNMQQAIEVPKREDLPKLGKKRLAEHLYDFYIETGVVDPQHGAGKDEWVRRMLHGVGSSRAAKKDDLVRQLGSILDERESDIRYIDAYVAENGLESLRDRVRIVSRFPRNTLETELDARDDTAIPDERNASLSSYTTAEITELVEHYTAYRRPYATQLVDDWEVSMAAGEINYRATVEGIIEREYQNRPNYLDNRTSALIHSFFVRQREEGLEYLDERQYQALYQSHMDGDNLLECLGQEYETNFEGRLTSDEDITRLIEQFTYTYYSDVLIDRKIVGEQIPEMAEIMAIYSNNHPRSVYDARLEAKRFATETWEPYISIESAEGKSISAGVAWLKPGMILPLSEAEKQFTSLNAAFVKAGVKEEVKINFDFIFERKLSSIANFSFTFGTENTGLIKAVENYAKASQNPELRDYAIYFAQHKDISALVDQAIADELPIEEQYDVQGYVLTARKAVDMAVPFAMYSLPKMSEEEVRTAQPFRHETKYGSPVNSIAESSAAPGKYVAIIDNSEQKEDTFTGQYPPSFIIAHDYNPESGKWNTGAFGFASYDEARDYYRANYGVDLGENGFPTPSKEHRESNATAPRAALIRTIQEEFDSFKAAEMKKAPEEIFGNMQRIHFYTQVANFFSNEENVAALSDAAIAVLNSESPSNLSLLYDYYLKKEYSGVDNSEQMRVLIDEYIKKNFPERAYETVDRSSKELLQEPLFGLVYNWKGLKDENSVYTAAQLGSVDPDFDPALDVQDGAFAANKTYTVYKLNGATAEETAANVKAFMTGSKNFETEQAPLIPGWYWETVNYNLFTGEVNPTVEKLISHFGLTEESLRMQEEELSTIEKLQAQAQELVESTGKPHVLIEWSESGEVPNETIMTLEEADRHLRALNAEHSEEGYYKTKLHVYYQDVDGIGVYGDMRYDIGTERGGLVEHIEDYAGDFTTDTERQGRLQVANILREYLQSVTTEESSVQQKINGIVDRIVKEGTENTSEGNWIVYFDEFGEDEEFVREHQDEIATALEKREAVSDVMLTPDGFDTNYYLDFCLNYEPKEGDLTPDEEQKQARAQEPPQQKQNIKSLLGGKYNAEELQRYLTKELEENALKNERSQQEFIAFLASFRSRQYSVRNQLMLYIQAAQNGYLPVFGTFEEWKGKGTSIQPGSHGLTICRPIFTDVYYTIDVGADGEWEERRYRKFGLSEEKLKELEKRVKEGTARKETELTSFIYTDSVFSMSQTTMTEEQRIEYLQRYNAQNTSTENEALYEKLKTVAAELGRPVVEKPIKGEELGWVERADNGTIVIKEDMPVDAKISVLTHEVGHKLLHIQNATAENRAQKEVQAQLFSHLAMLKLGIDAEKQFSLSYINNWLKASEKDPPVFDADGRELSRGEVLQLNLAAVIPAVDALLKTVGENDQAIDAEALKALKDYKEEQKPQAEQRKPAQKEEKVEIEPLRIVKSTDKAVMVKLPGANPEDPKKGLWLPRSRISTNKDGYVYEATPSLIKEKGLTPKGTLAAVKGAKAQRSLKI